MLEVVLYEGVEHLRFHELINNKLKIGEIYLECLTVLQPYLVPAPIYIHKTHCLYPLLGDRMDILDGPVTSAPLGSIMEGNRAKILPLVLSMG